MRRRPFAIGVALACAGCPKSQAFECTADIECSPGRCEATHFCSFASSGCPSGFKYGQWSGPYANHCVSPVDAMPDTPSIPLYPIGGTVSGLASSTVTLEDTSGAIVDDKTVVGNGSPSVAFTFGTALTNLAMYRVIVKTQPPAADNLTCTPSSNATGTIMMAAASVTVQCLPTGTDPGIACGASFCTPSTQVCCHSPTTSTTSGCASGCVSPDIAQPCDDPADCGGTQVCCAKFSNTMQLKSVSCVTSISNCSATMGGSVEYLCTQTSDCAGIGAGTCVLDATFGWKHCV